MSSEWQLTTLGAVTTWMSGGTPTKDDAKYWGGDIPWISANSMHSTRYSKSELRLTAEGLACGSRMAPKDTVLLLVRGGALHNRIPVGIAERDVAFNQDVKAIVAKPELLRPWYLLYWLLGHESFLLGAVVEFTGIGAGKLDTKRMQGLEMRLPSLTEQDQILKVIKPIDDRITLLRETNTTLEAIAPALFKSWFVDFDPVRAKLARRSREGGNPEAGGAYDALDPRLRGNDGTGMDETTAALFPDGFEESELGLVPRGWRVSTLGESTSYLSRGISPKYVEDSGIVVINQKCIRDFMVDLTKSRRHDQAQRKVDGRELQVGDVLVNSTGVGTLGRVAQILDLDEPAIVDSHVTVVRAGAALSWNYLGLSMMKRQAEIESMGEGTTGQTELSRGKLAILKLVVPSSCVLHEFDTAVVPMRERFAANQKQAQTLATLRDTLLPRLISGALRLPDAQAHIEEAV